jgi:NitT/TauT family transport system substrate-binding protein
MNAGRREFMRGLTLAGLLGTWPDPARAEPPTETTRIRLLRRPQLCEAPQYVAEELLQGEGFTDIQYVRRSLGPAEDALGTGDADISMLFGPPMLLRVDAGEPIVFLAGVHVGCIELFAQEGIRTIGDLKGKKVAITAFRAGAHVFISTMAAHVGLNPDKDINWAFHPLPEWPGLLAAGKVDAVLALPPLAQEMRAKKIGRVVLDTRTDRPWSQYFCCMVVGNKDFVRQHPVATKRVVRAILKASNICALEPERVARFLMDKGYVDRLDYAVQSLREVPYGRWNEYDPNDTVRFYALRLREAGLIKSTPQKILAQGADWRFLNELKKELKG